MKRYNFRMALLSCMFVAAAGTGLVDQAAAPKVQQMSENEESAFYDDLQTGIKKSQDQYTKLKGAINPEKATDEEKKALMNAATALEVKYTLYKNFYNTPSVQSPVVRKQLEDLFQKNFITLEDLTKLKKTVSAERTKMGLPANPAAPAPAGTPESK